MSSEKRDLKTLKEWAETSPFYQLLGIRVEHLAPGYSRLTLPIRKELFQPQGAVHGGAVGALADSAVALALLSQLPPKAKAVTIEMKVNFLAPVVEGRLVAEGRIIFKGSRIAVGDVEVRDQKGKMVAKSVATYMVVV